MKCSAMSGAVEPAGAGTLQSGAPRKGSKNSLLTGGQLVERVVVVDAEEVAHGDAARLQGAVDGVVEEHAAEGAHVHAPRGRLRVVDDLRGAGVDAPGDIGEPEHGRL
jgi:hypothetical protein